MTRPLLSHQLQRTLEDIGGEALQSSGFEDETLEPGFSENAPDASELTQPPAQ